MTRLLTAFLAVCALIGLAATPALAATKTSSPGAERAASGRSVPQGFFGMNADGPMLYNSALADREYGTMVADGVESVRVIAFWERMQPYRRVSQVPPSQRSRFRTLVGGVPTDFSTMDSQVASTARRGLSMLPVVLGAPRWAAFNFDGRVSAIPKDVRTYTRFLQALVRRYGPKGSGGRGLFWRRNPRIPYRPLREWQIWNEVNISLYWPQPFDSGPTSVPDGPRRDAKTYPYLLRASYKAIKQVDRHAKVVLAALTNASWTALGFIYRSFHGKGGRYFDAVAIQTYTWLPENVVNATLYARRVMNRYGDRRKPIYWTELNWPAACAAYSCAPVNGGSQSNQLTRNVYGTETDDAGAAQKLDDAMRLMARDRRRLGLTRVYIYTWLSRFTSTEDPFDYSGMRDLHADGQVTDKPALIALRSRALALEGCRSAAKASVSRCR